MTALTKVPRKEFSKHWTDKATEAFKATKAMIAHDVLLTCPGPNKVFVIETDASDYQLGAVCYQDGRPVLFWSRKSPMFGREGVLGWNSADIFLPLWLPHRTLIFA